MYLTPLRFGTLDLLVYKQVEPNQDAAQKPTILDKGGIAMVRYKDRPQDEVNIHVPEPDKFLKLGTSQTAAALHQNNLFRYEKQNELQQRLEKILGENGDLDTTTGDPAAVAYYQKVRPLLYQGLVNDPKPTITSNTVDQLGQILGNVDRIKS